LRRDLGGVKDGSTANLARSPYWPAAQRGLLHTDTGDASRQADITSASRPQGTVSNGGIERYQRSEKALVVALTEMYVQGVSTRTVKEVTEQLCGHEFSSSTISRMTERLDEDLEKFARRRLEEEYPYLILGARHERVREDSVISSRAVQVAIGINWEGRRSVLAVEIANRESTTSWRDFLLGLKQRGLRGVATVISDDHVGLRNSIPEVLPEANSQAVMFTFCGTLWTTCRARKMTTA
jgi:transposase-like protein